MFRVSTISLIRSTQNCNYSLQYCAATSIQRGQAWPRWREVDAQKIWPVPEAVVEVLCTPDDRCVWHPKLVEWIKRETNLMSLALLFRYLMLNTFRMLIHPSSGTCDLFVELFHGLYCSGSMCVGVTVWFCWGGVVSVCRLKQCFSLHTDTTPSTSASACIRIPHHPSQTTT